MIGQADVDAAYEKLIAEFPIENYVDESVRFQMQGVTREISRFVPEIQGRRLLDLGCGPMDKTAILQYLGFQCFAADDLSDPWHLRDKNDEKIVGFARRMGIEFYRQRSDDYSIPFELESFDIVCSLAVIEHLHQSPRELLNCMGQFAVPNGLIVVGMPNAVNLRKRLSVAIGKSNHVPVDQFYYSEGIWRGHVREYTLRETEFICRSNGFDVLTATTCEALAPVKLRRPMREIYTFLGNVIPTLRSNLIVICRKPRDWQPVLVDNAAFKDALKRSVPRGVA